MATVAWSILNAGTVANTAGAILGTNAEERWVKLITFYNTNATPQVVILYLFMDGDAPREVARYELEQGESASWDEQVALGPDDQIYAETTTASAVPFTVSGGTKVP